MIKIITCSNCHKEGRFPYRLTWTFEEKTCETCHNNQEERQKYYFCSEKCLKDFVDVFVFHEHNWIHYSFSGVSVTNEGEVLGRYEICKICSLMRFNKDFRTSEIEALGGGTNG